MNRWMIATVILAVACVALAGTSVAFYRTPFTVTATPTVIVNPTQTIYLNSTTKLCTVDMFRTGNTTIWQVTEYC
jgi:hypothetical protein